MNNKSKYMESFSGVHHSDELTERILNMTDKRYHKIKFSKMLVCAVVVIITIVCGCMTVNAATDGAVSDFVEKKISILINGKEAETNVVEHKEIVDENGNKSDYYKIEAQNDNGVDTFEYYEKQYGDCAEVIVEANTDSVGAEEADGVIEFQLNTDDICEPTTSVNE